MKKTDEFYNGTIETDNIIVDSDKYIPFETLFKYLISQILCDLHND